MSSRNLHSYLGLAIVLAGVAVVVQQSRTSQPPETPPSPPAVVASSGSVLSYTVPVPGFTPSRSGSFDFGQLAARTMITTLPIATPMAPFLLKTPEGETVRSSPHGRSCDSEPLPPNKCR